MKLAFLKRSLCRFGSSRLRSSPVSSSPLQLCNIDLFDSFSGCVTPQRKSVRDGTHESLCGGTVNVFDRGRQLYPSVRVEDHCASRLNGSVSHT